MKGKIKEYFSDVLKPSYQRLWQSLACHRFVSHMTGLGAQIALSIRLKEYLIAAEMILAPVFFILGATYAGTLVDRRLLSDRQANINRRLMVIVGLDFAVLVGGLTDMFGEFGEFGEPLVAQRDFFLLFTLCFCCGLQNGPFVSLSGGLVRTTHLTGICTDIGLNLVRYLTLKDPVVRDREATRNWPWLKTIIAFSSGSRVSAIIFQKAGYWGFLGSTIIAFCIMVYVKLVLRKIASVFENPVEV